MRIHELFEPKKPTDKIKSSTLKRSGVQGSTNNIAQRTFTTKKGNVVDVQFKTKIEDGVKETDVTFYVNGTLHDNSSTLGKDIDNDFEILAGVGYIVKVYLDKAKISRCTFVAYSSEKDIKTKFNLPIEKPKRNLFAALDGLYARVTELLKTPEDMTQSDKYNLTLEIIGALKKYLDHPVERYNIADITRMYYQLRTATDMKLLKYPEMNDALTKLEVFMEVVDSYGPNGVQVKHNRRFEVYLKMFNKFFSHDWDIKTYGDKFILTRKTS